MGFEAPSHLLIDALVCSDGAEVCAVSGRRPCPEAAELGRQDVVEVGGAVGRRDIVAGAGHSVLPGLVAVHAGDPEPVLGGVPAAAAQLGES